MNTSTSPSGSSDASPPSLEPSHGANIGGNRNNFPRRTHTKSRRGCRRCKQRKIKCDEVHPECGNCVKHNVSCDFKNSGAVALPAPASKRAISRLTVPKHNAPSSSSSSNLPNQPSLYILEPTSCPTRSQIPDWSNRERMLELRIFHHYTSMSYTRDYKMPIAQELWTVLIPSLAFEQPCLMDSLLACSALHMRVMTAHDGALTQASHKYMARAISTYLETLRHGITSQNFDAMYLTAVLIAFHTFLNRRFDPENATADNMALQWFQPFQGANVIAQAAPPSSPSSVIVHLFPGMRVPLSRCYHEIDECPFGVLLRGLTGGEPDYEIYRYATSHMCSVLYCRPPRFFVRFLSDAPPRLSELLKMKDPRSLVIAYAFFTLMKTIPIQIWWLDGAADGEIEQIKSVVPKAWIPMLEQADKVIWGYSEMCDVSGIHFHAAGNQIVPMVSLWQQNWRSGAPNSSMTSVAERELLWTTDPGPPWDRP